MKRPYVPEGWPQQPTVSIRAARHMCKRRSQQTLALTLQLTQRALHKAQGILYCIACLGH